MGIKFCKYVICSLFIISFGVSNAQRSYSHKKNDFPRLIIGPEVGAFGYMAFLDSGEGKFYGEYSLGAKMIIKPWRQFGFHTGFSYHKGIKNYHYYSSPLIFAYTDNSKRTFAGGLLLNFDAKDDKVDFNNPNIGVAIGAGTENILMMLIYNPKIPMLEEVKLSEIRFFLGLGIRINVGFVLL